MKIIDANTGQHVRVGDVFSNIDGAHQLLAVEEGVFKARALFRTVSISAHPGHPQVPLGDRWVDLVVRRMHPAFPFEKVAFIPS